MRAGVYFSQSYVAPYFTLGQVDRSAGEQGPPVYRTHSERWLPRNGLEQKLVVRHRVSICFDCASETIFFSQSPRPLSFFRFHYTRTFQGCRDASLAYEYEDDYIRVRYGRTYVRRSIFSLVPIYTTCSGKSPLPFENPNACEG